MEGVSVILEFFLEFSFFEESINFKYEVIVVGFIDNRFVFIFFKGFML